MRITEVDLKLKLTMSMGFNISKLWERPCRISVEDILFEFQQTIDLGNLSTAKKFLQNYIETLSHYLKTNELPAELWDNSDYLPKFVFKKARILSLRIQDEHDLNQLIFELKENGWEGLEDISLHIYCKEISDLFEGCRIYSFQENSWTLRISRRELCEILGLDAIVKQNIKKTNSLIEVVFGKYE